MGKVIGILIFVLGIWAATQFAAGNSPFSTKGPSRSQAATTASESGAKVQSAYDEGHARVEALLED